MYASFITENMELGSTLIKSLADLISLMWNSVISLFDLSGSFLTFLIKVFTGFGNPLLTLGFTVTISVTVILFSINIVKGIF